MSDLVLAADVGGTKTNLALYRVRDGALHAVREASVASRAYPGAGEVLRSFLAAGGERVAAVAVGIAGPVSGDAVRTPNLPWTVTREQVATAVGTDRVWLLNDLLATAHGVIALPDERLVTLQAGARGGGSAVLLAAGTGLGVALLPWDGGAYRPAASEGGHADFAPVTKLQQELLSYLHREHDHVSIERVLSGPGLHNIYRFLVDTGRAVEDPEVGARLGLEDPAAVIGAAGTAGTDPASTAALEMFVEIYGAVAANLALITLAVGGVYLGGGIAPKIVETLRQERFLRAFHAKGRFAELLRAVPVWVVAEPKAALLGAGRLAAGKLGWM